MTVIPIEESVRGQQRSGRRGFIGLCGTALAGAGALAIIGRAGSAHDGTPEATPQASPAASPVADDGEYVINAIDLAFEPNALTIPANTDVTVQIMNSGVILHDFTADQLGVKSDLLSSDESTTVTINAAPGTYPFHCSVPGHKLAGMTGTLTVE